MPLTHTYTKHRSNTMSNLSPFEIRLELLKMAKDLLTEEFLAKKESITEGWVTKIEIAKLNGTALPDHPGFPTYPSEKEIIIKAQELNSFVSNTDTKPSKK